MEVIAQAIKTVRESPLVSSPSPSNSKVKLNGIEYDSTRNQIERYWMNEFVRSMKEVEPGFIIDGRNSDLLRALYGWVWERVGRTGIQLNNRLDASKGLLLWGPLGVGKSVLLRGLQIYEGKINRACFGFENKSLGFVLTSAAEIALRYAEQGMKGIVRYTDREFMANLAIDELGREPTDAKHFGTGINVVQTILQLRYEVRREIITHVTTNLDPNTQFSGIYGDYIADRVKELFNVIEIKGDTRR